MTDVSTFAVEWIEIESRIRVEYSKNVSTFAVEWIEIYHQ